MRSWLIPIYRTLAELHGFQKMMMPSGHTADSVAITAILDDLKALYPGDATDAEDGSPLRGHGGGNRQRGPACVSPRAQFTLVLA